MNQYDKQANDWAEKYGVRFSATFAGHGKFFPDDDSTRDRYSVILFRESLHMQIDFKQSLVDSGYREHFSRGPYWEGPGGIKARKQTKKAPTLYDVLACITKYDPGTFKDFCDNYGYSDDSIQALQTYQAVSREYRDFAGLCQNDEAMMDEAREIQ